MNPNKINQMNVASDASAPQNGASQDSVSRNGTAQSGPSRHGAAGRGASREAVIVRTSIVGIVVNVLLAAFKAAVGILSHSIAITLDAVNNLSDATSSVITIIGTKLAGKPADRKHPFGHGRIEYLSAMLISILVLYAGVTSLVESVKKILRPEVPEYTPAGLVIIAAAVIAKVLLGRYVKSVGQRVQSDALVDSGQDAALDAVISASTLLAAAVYLLAHVSLEAWLGAVISIVIIRSGVEMLKDALSRVLGERADAELARALKDTVRSFPGVQGAYDLVLHNYGPDAFQGSVHIEVPDTFSAEELDELIRAITLEVYRKHRVYLTAIGVYSVNTRDPYVAEIREKVKETVLSRPYIREMHGFHLDPAAKEIRFDAVVSFDAPDRKAAYRETVEAARRLYPEYTFQIAMDTDFSEP